MLEYFVAENILVQSSLLTVKSRGCNLFSFSRRSCNYGLLL